MLNDLLNIYWCEEKDEWGGLFVIAKSRGRAKAIFANEMDIDYTEVRTHLMKKGCKESSEGYIDIGSPLLYKYGLHYEIDKGWNEL